MDGNTTAIESFCSHGKPRSKAVSRSSKAGFQSPIGHVACFLITLLCKNEEELMKLLGLVIIANGSVLSNIHRKLLLKKKGGKGEIGSAYKKFVAFVLNTKRCYWVQIERIWRTAEVADCGG
ncbi:histone H2AX, partial [Olea europaea subsp. europaea]